MSDWEVVEDSEWEMVEPQTPKSESLKDKILRYGVKNPAAGVVKTGRQLANIPSNLAQLMGDKTSSDLLSVGQDFDIDKAFGLPEDRNTADMLIQMLPEIAGSFAVPAANLGKAGSAIGKIPKAGKYIQKMLSESIPQAGYAGAMSAPENAGQNAALAGATMAPFSLASQLAQSTSPWARRVAQGIGAIGGYEVGKHGSSALGASPLGADLAGIVAGTLGARGMTSSRMKQQHLTEDMNPDVVGERLGASERLGLDYLTPAEASMNPFLGARQGSLGTTSEGSQAMLKKAKGRVESEEKSINKLLDDIYHGDSMAPEVERLYKESHPTLLPKEFSEKFNANEVVKHAKKDVLNTPAYKEGLKGVSEDSVQYWDHVKQALDDMAERAPKKEARLINNVKKDLVTEIDKHEPKYKEARALAERKITREKLEKAFDRADPSGKSFYKALASKEKFEKLLNNVRNVPGADQKLKDMRLLFNDLISPPSIKGAAALERTSMNKPRSSAQAITSSLENALTKGKNDKEMIEFITSPNWNDMMADLNKISDKQKRLAKFIEYFGKATAQGVKSREPYLETENYDVY